MITTHALLEEDMFRERDALVDSEPVRNDQHEVLEHGLEVVVARDGDGDVDARADECPDEAWHARRRAGKDLQRQGDGVDVRAVVSDDGEREDDEAELAEAAEGRDEDLSEETADVVVFVGGHVGGVVDRGGHDGCAEHLGEEERDDEAAPGPKEDRQAADADGLVDGVVCCVTGPSRRKPEYRCRERKDCTGFTLASAHGDVIELS